MSRGEKQTLIILDRNKPGASELAMELMSFWRQQGVLDREAIEDRRVNCEEGKNRGRRLLDCQVIHK